MAVVEEEYWTIITATSLQIIISLDSGLECQPIIDPIAELKKQIEQAKASKV